MCFFLGGGGVGRTGKDYHVGRRETKIVILVLGGGGGGGGGRGAGRCSIQIP